MKTAVFVLALVAAAYALPQFSTVIPVLRRTEVRDSVGQFMFDYLTGDGTSYTETGRLVPNADNTDYVLVKEGTVSYTSPEGIPITLTYKADADGFQPIGAHLPVPVVA